MPRGAASLGPGASLERQRQATGSHTCGGASPGPGGSLVGEPTSPAERARAACGPGSAGARWGQRPRSRPRKGAGKWLAKDDPLGSAVANSPPGWAT